MCYVVGDRCFDVVLAVLRRLKVYHFTESLGLGMSGVRHPPANDAADHVTATPFRECKHYQAI